jgi:hypothetical protein
MTILSYSFSLTPPPAKQSHAYSEFLLDLPASWRQLTTPDDDTLTFQSDEDGAAIIIAADFHDIPDDEAQALAEQCISSRLGALEDASAGPVQVFQRAIKPHASGRGLEISFAAHAEGEHVHLYLGYVSARKILHFSMVCPPGKHEAVALFNAVVPGFRPRLP